MQKIEPETTVRFLIDGEVRCAEVAAVVFDREATTDRGDWGILSRRLTIARTRKGAILVRRVALGILGAPSVTWHVAASPEEAVKLLDADDPLEGAAIQSAGWATLGAREA